MKCLPSPKNPRNCAVVFLGDDPLPSAKYMSLKCEEQVAVSKELYNKHVHGKFEKSQNIKFLSV